MRTLRVTAAVVVSAVLMTLSTTAGIAQDGPCIGEVEFSEDGMTWSSTDPRLAGDATGEGGWTFYGVPSEDAGTPGAAGASYVIINEDGTWNCVDSQKALPEPDAAGHTLIFTGTGDYEGLTAHVRIDWSSYPFGFSGVIVESGPPEDPTLEG